MHQGQTTIEKRLRDPGHGFIVALPIDKVRVDGIVQTTLRAYFFKVTEASPLHYLYDQLASFNNAESRSYDYLGDAGHGAGDDIFRIEDDDYHVLHFGWATKDPNLRVYEKVSPSDPNTALDRTTEDPDPTVPSDFDFITSKQIPDRFDPPTTTERVSFRNDDNGEFLQWGFYAEDSISAGNAEMVFTGAAYKLAPVTDNDTQQRMLDVARTNPNNPDIPTTLVQVGGVETFNIGQSEPDSWSASHRRTLTYDLSDAST